MPTPKARFDITAQDKTKGAFTSVNKSLGGLKSAFATIGAGLTVVGLSSLVKETLNANDNIAKLSVSTGLAVETLNSYSLGAQIAGTELEGLTKGVAKFQRSIFDSVAGLLEAKQSFEAMNIEVQNTDGTLRDTEVLLLEVADRFKTYEDGAGKAALAQKLFGRSGVQLIPFLNQGSAAIREYIEENNALGNTLTNEVAAASERVNDNFVRLSTSTQGVKRDLVEGLLPALEAVTELMVDFGKEGGETANILGSTLGATLKGIATGVIFVKNSLDIVVDSFRSTGAAIASLASGDWRSALDIMSSGGRDMLSEYEDIIEGVGKLWFEVSTDILNDADATSDKIAAPVILALSKTKTATKEIKDEVDAAFAAIDAQFAALDKQEGLKLAGLEPPSADELARAAVFEETRTPAEKLSAEIERLNLLFNNGADDFDTYSRAMFAAQDEFDGLAEKAEETSSQLSEFAIGAARASQAAFSDLLFDPFSDANDSMLEKWTTTLRQLASQAASAAIFDFVGASSPFQSLSTSLGGLFGGRQLARGGRVAAGETVIVGEGNGGTPELFTPDVAGTVTPMGSGTGDMNFYFSVQGQLNNQTAQQAGLTAAQAFNLATLRDG